MQATVTLVIQHHDPSAGPDQGAAQLRALHAGRAHCLALGHMDEEAGMRAFKSRDRSWCLRTAAADHVQ
jgi:hypothetical protein